MNSFFRKHPHLLYVGPVSLWLLAFVILPLILIVYYSFVKVGVPGTSGTVFTFENYSNFMDPKYLEVFVRTLLYSFSANLLCLFIGYPLAYWIVRFGGRWKILLVFLVILPSWTSYLIRIYALKTLMAHGGLLNNLLLNLGVISSPIEVLYTPTAVVLGLTYTWLPFMVLPIYAALEGLDPSLLEASADLGATPMERLLTVTLPLTRGGIFAGTIFVFIPALGEWLVPMLLGGARVMMAGNLVTLHFIVAGNLHAGCSIATMLTAMVILIMYLCIKFGGEEALERIV